MNWSNHEPKLSTEFVLACVCAIEEDLNEHLMCYGYLCYRRIDMMDDFDMMLMGAEMNR